MHPFEENAYINSCLNIVDSRWKEDIQSIAHYHIGTSVFYEHTNSVYQWVKDYIKMKINKYISKKKLKIVFRLLCIVLFVSIATGC